MFLFSKTIVLCKVDSEVLFVFVLGLDKPGGSFLNAEWHDKAGNPRSGQCFESLRESRNRQTCHFDVVSSYCDDQSAQRNRPGHGRESLVWCRVFDLNQATHLGKSPKISYKLLISIVFDDLIYFAIAGVPCIEDTSRESSVEVCRRK